MNRLGVTTPTESWINRRHYSTDGPFGGDRKSAVVSMGDTAVFP